MYIQGVRIISVAIRDFKTYWNRLYLYIGNIDRKRKTQGVLFKILP